MRNFFISLAILVSLALPLAARGENTNARDSKPSAPKSAPAQAAKTSKVKELPAFTPEREAAAMTFVRMYHAELADLLDQLKLQNKSEYERAIRELFRQSERLAQAQERNPQRYDLELRAWKLNSRIQVLVARMVMSRDLAIESQLREALFEQIELRKETVEFDRKRMGTRMAELDAELAEIDRNRQRQVDEKMNRFLHTVKKPGSKTETKNQDSKTKN